MLKQFFSLQNQKTKNYILQQKKQKTGKKILFFHRILWKNNYKNMDNN